MRAKDYMLGIQAKSRAIERKLDTIRLLAERAEHITATLGGAKVASSSTGGTIESCVTQMVVLEGEIKEQARDYSEAIEECSKMLDLIEPNYSEILYKRYFEGETWERIACDMGYTYQWVCVLHGRALQRIQPMVDELI